MVDKIAFTSKINFVNSQIFYNIQKNRNIDFFKEGFIKSDEFVSSGIRTCTAGGLINSKTGYSVGFHIYDNLINLEKINEIIENIFNKIPNPDRALIIGGKNLKFANYSMPVFVKIHDAILSKVKNVALFKEHINPFAQTDIHYALNNDTWTIHSVFRPLYDAKDLSISSEEDLQKCFREIKIPKNDELHFVV